VIVAYDLRFACGHFVGIGTYAFALLEALLALPGDERYVVLWDPQQAHARFDLAGVRSHPRVTWVERPYPPLRPWALVQVGGWLRRLTPDVYFSPFHLLPLMPGCPCVLTIHDVRPLRFRNELDPVRGALFRRSLQRACRARLLVTVSDFSRAEIVALLPAAPARVRTVRPGVQPRLGGLAPERPPAAPDGPFALVVGDNRPHKNHAVLASAWARFGAVPPLALVGAGPVDARHPDLAALARRAGTQAYHLGRVSQHELAWLYQHATLLVFPSRYEGFGSPLAEAFAQGLPAVVSDLPVFREIGGDAACFVESDRADRWAEVVDDLARDARARERMCAAGRARAAGLTYEQTARGVLEVLHEAQRKVRP
jgi:glycosyltransferase involved in cell wall biosynthesis